MKIDKQCKIDLIKGVKRGFFTEEELERLTPFFGNIVSTEIIPDTDKEIERRKNAPPEDEKKEAYHTRSFTPEFKKTLLKVLKKGYFDDEAVNFIRRFLGVEMRITVLIVETSEQAEALKELGLW